jgi:hypothetical protein
MDKVGGGRLTRKVHLRWSSILKRLFGSSYRTMKVSIFTKDQNSKFN